MKDDSRNYLVVGTFVLGMLVLLVVALARVSGFTGARDPYHIEYESVIGLNDGSQVFYEGYPVGEIEGITWQPDARSFRVDVGIDTEYPIPDDSVATIAAPGFLSAFAIDIRVGSSSTFLEPGQQIRSEERQDIVSSLSSVAGQLSGILESDVRPLLRELTQGAPAILDQLESITTEVEATVGRINAILSDENVGKVQGILVNLDSTSSDFARFAANLQITRDELDQALRSVNQLLDEESGTLHHAAVDLHQSLEALARNMDAIARNLELTTRNLSEFSRQVREDPSVILRGREVEDDGADF